MLEATRLALEGAGYDVLTQDRATGSAALILHEHPALALVDVNMPGIAGDTFVNVLMKGQRQSDTVVLLHSSLEPKIEPDELRLATDTCLVDVRRAGAAR